MPETASMFNGWYTLNKVLEELAESCRQSNLAFERWRREWDTWLEDELAAMPPVEREAYDMLIAEGWCILDALVYIEDWPDFALGRATATREHKHGAD